MTISSQTTIFKMNQAASTQTTQACGASVIGNQHKAGGLTNQDAWLSARGTYGHLLVVCDGVGSKPHAALGSRAATHAVREAVIRWSKATQAPTMALVRLIELFWKLRILPELARDCATTCLFAYVTPFNEVLICGIGDGIVLLRSPPGIVEVLHGRGAGDFVNQTAFLGSEHGQSKWTFRKIALRDIDLIMIATDGVADDLLPERYTELMQWFASNTAGVSSAIGGQRLKRALRNWETPKSGDDKTIALLHVRNTHA